MTVEEYYAAIRHAGATHDRFNCHDLKGLLVAKQTDAELRQAIPQYIADLYKASGVTVLVAPADDGSEPYHPWIAMPVEVAKKALEASERS
jgi:hypothetical protein